MIYVDFDNVLFDPGGACLFDDVLPFLKSFRPSQLVLVASGDKDVQMAKIRASGLEPYFHAVHVVGRKPTVIDIPNRAPTFFIDDAPWEIEAMKSACGWVICIQVRKPPSGEGQLQWTDKDDFYFSSLAHLAKFIKEYRPH